MKIGIFEVGRMTDLLKQQYERYDNYPDMFVSLLDRAQRDFSYRSYAVLDGEMPASVDECDGWLITGSRHGVYEDHEWIAPLEDFIRELHAAQKPLVGVCFGHQIIAQALGGKVVLSDLGWGVGVESYRIDKRQSWMKTGADNVRINAFHQDQVVDLPPAAEVYLSSDHCPYAGLAYGDSVISFQAHPEFEELFELVLLKLERGQRVPEAEAAVAIEGIEDSGEKADTQLLAEWIAEFFVSRNR